MTSDKKKLPEGWTTLLLLAGMVMSVTWAMSSARWIEGLQVIEWVALAGLAAGILLAKTRFPASVAHLFSLVYGAAWIGYLGTTLLPPAFAPRERLLELGYHLNAWLWKVIHGGSSSDSLMFILFLSCVVWLFAYVATWATFRTHRIWWAILPTATVLLISVYWGPPRLLMFLIAYVGFMLLFFIRFNLFCQQQAWSKAHVRYDSEIVWDFLRYGLAFIVVVMVLAWGAPGAAASEEMATFWARFSEPWERVKDTWNRLFFTSRYYGDARPNVFGETMSLGGAVHLGDQVVMDVASPGGRYWRATVYDEYTGSGWQNNDEEMAYLDFYDPDFVVPQFEMRRFITQTYTSYLPGRTQLFAAAQPVGIDRPTKIRANRVPGRLPEDGRPGELFNASMIYARAPLEGGESYRVISAIPAADEDSLRAAGTDYPQWVKTRYLQLPDLLPQRVRDLAEEITRDQTNLYDKATALESYLRKTIKYNDLIDSPPPDQDRVDWFLFDSQEGYCDYYSSALAVMARAIGIPARVAAGYARGDYNDEAGVYRVRDHHGHAWVEVFLPRYGWIEFEPTASESPIVRPRPASANTNDARGNRGFPGGEDELDRLRDMMDDDYYSLPPLEMDRPWWVTALWIVGGLLAVASVVGGGYWWLEEQGMVHLGLVQKVYGRMTRFGRLLNVPRQESQTPYEYAAELSAEIPAGRKAIDCITALFVEDRFSPRVANEEESATAWRNLRLRMWRRWFSRWLERFQATSEQDSSSPNEDD
jgi:transglutaminase-like putative cysteine protease